MPDGNHHIVHSLKYQVQFGGNGIEDPQNALSQLHYQRVEDILQETYDYMSADGQYILIDTLELDLGIIKMDNWEEHFPEQLRKILTLKLKESISKSTSIANQVQLSDDEEKLSNSLIYSEAEREERTLLFFLKHGYLNWTVPVGKTVSVNELFEKAVTRKSDQFNHQLIALFRQSGIAIPRFMVQIRPSLQKNWIQIVYPNSINGWNEIDEELSDQIHNSLGLSRKKVEKIKGWLKSKYLHYLVSNDVESYNIRHFLDFSSTELISFINKEFKDADLRELSFSSSKPHNYLPNFIVELVTEKFEKMRLSDKKEKGIIKSKSKEKANREEIELNEELQDDKIDSGIKTDGKLITGYKAPVDSEVSGEEEKPDQLGGSPSGSDAGQDDSVLGNIKIGSEPLNAASEKTSFEFEDDKPTEVKEDLKKGLIAPNAGLVLLWPYMDILFNELQLLTDSRFKGESELIKALFILHFLATGNMKAEEHELLVPKIITGFGFEESIPIELTLENPILKECDILLETAIRNWTVLKSTSPDGLREAFLQRTALIRLQNDKWNFMFERKGMDVLIDRLPYGLSIVKLKWLDHPIQVSW